MADFTAGKWVARRRRIGEYVLNWQVCTDAGYTDSKGKRIAIAVPGGPNAEANSRLIAKSPDMYDLLQDIRHQLATDSDLDSIAGAAKYQKIVDMIDQIQVEVEMKEA